MTRSIASCCRTPIVVGLVLLRICAGAAVSGKAASEPSGVKQPTADDLSSAPARAAAKRPAIPPIDGPRKLLQAYGIDESHWARLVDGTPLKNGEVETLLNVIYRVCDFRPEVSDLPQRVHGFRLLDIERWAHPQVNPVALARHAEASRGELFRLAGHVRLLEVCCPFPEQVRRFELKQYYRCELLLAPGQQPAVIYTRNVPRRWRQGGVINQRASAYGMFLKTSQGDPQQPKPIFVAPRIAWHPPTLLGNLGMDVGLLDDVEDRREITEAERECFYQMLAAVKRAKPRQLLEAAYRQLQQVGKEAFSVVPLFNEPQTQRGNLVMLTGTARRVVRIRLGTADADIVRRLGLDHYYNIWLFTEDSQNNPLVFCVPSLPQGMPEGDGPDYREQVRLAGFFLKSWAYPIASRVDAGEAVPGSQPAMRQLAPLLIGEPPVWLPRQPPARNTLAGAIAGGLFLLALLGIWAALWRYARGDRQFRQQTIARTLTPDVEITAGASLSDIAAGSAPSQQEPPAGPP